MIQAKNITGADRPSDKELLRRAIEYSCAPVGAEKIPRWVCVRDIFNVGSTTATRLCVETGVDPEELLSSPRCENCPFDEFAETPFDEFAETPFDEFAETPF